jgi:hypothetical protein
MWICLGTNRERDRQAIESIAVFETLDPPQATRIKSSDVDDILTRPEEN